MSREKMKDGYQELVWTGRDEVLWAAEWTWQLNKEGLQQIRAFAAHAGNVEVEYIGQGNRHLATTVRDSINLDDFEPMGTPAMMEPQFSGEVWTPSAFQKFMLGIEEGP